MAKKNDDVTPDNTGTTQAERDEKGRFRKGYSGNPAGCATGSRHRITRALQELFDGEGEALAKKCIEMAKGGDMVALKACLDRLIPPVKERPIAFDLPAIHSSEDATRAVAAISDACLRGDLDQASAQGLTKVVDVFRRMLECGEFERRLKDLECQVLELCGKGGTP